MSKIFNDPIHGTIRVTGVSLKIIDTPQFQRLRYLKQLGGGYFVYPGATHTRFEHSIGTYHLAGKFARILKLKHPTQFLEDEITCIEIAGLCHDLGHGPFSHVFDNMFIPWVKPDCKWKHEDASVAMLEHLLEENDHVKKAFDVFDTDWSRLELVKDLILGGKETEHVQDPRVHGIRRTKPHLYEIVANSRTGIDVDKWDYFARDCHMVGIKNNFDHDRYMEMARIIEVDGKPRICTRDKEVINLYDMFHTREILYRRVYSHQVTRAVELMIVDALVKLDQTALMPGKNGKRKISECIDDMVAYSKLNDSILQMVEVLVPLETNHQDSDTALRDARDIVERIQKRDLYKCVSKRIVEDDFNRKKIPQIKQEVLKHTGTRTFDEQQFEIIVMCFDYGRGNVDPVAQVPFYRKSDLQKPIVLPEEEKPRMLPKTFRECALAVYSKHEQLDDDLDSCFNRWFTDEYLKNPSTYAVHQGR
ncbi:deoxynucleoside triphosphate triphosphohydrolase SAMHD1-like [Haliotis asinina]|uniref:deoxynucleoside triphosphate triphosphohydrolase SAMHD1-like n=1 Tax=Haliotis asinina TaxID=109174 RepID=UPI0035318925